MRYFSIIIMCVVFGAIIPTPTMAGKDYYLASPKQIARIIDAAKGEKRVLFLYASWCGYCRAHLPKIIELEKEKKDSVIAISLDKDLDTFSRYVATRHGSLPFTPIVWDRRGVLDREFERFGIKPGNAIPFTAWLDEYGYVKKQGVIKPRDSKAYILDNKKAPEAKVEGL